EERERRRLEQELKREREAEQRQARKTGAGKGRKQRAALSISADRQPAGGQRRRRGSEAGHQLQHGFERPVAPVVREVAIPEAITVGDLAQKMSVKAAVLIRELMKQGVMATIN